MKKLLLPILSIILLASSCTKQVNTDAPQKVSSNSQWVQGLANRNPLKDSTTITSVYFRFDTIVNDFEVNGIFYPSYFPEYGWDAHENGVYLYFRSLKTGKEYCYTTWNDTCGYFSSYFMSINISNIVCDKTFDGYKNGDAYIFRYYTTIDTISDNSLLPYAEYQFYDADFDGEDELIIGSYVGGPHGSPCYDIYDMTDSRLVQKKADDGFRSFWLDSDSEFDSENKQIRNTIYEGAYAWGEYIYNVNEEGQYHLLCHMYFESDFDHNIIHSDTTYYR
jgi:hypothetical protein